MASSPASIPALAGCAGPRCWAAAGADAAYSLHREDTGGGLLAAGGTTSADLQRRGRAATGPPPAGGVDGFVAASARPARSARALTWAPAATTRRFSCARRPGGLLVLGQTLGRAWPVPDTTRYHARNGQLFHPAAGPRPAHGRLRTVFGSGRATTDISPTAFGVDCYGRIAAGRLGRRPRPQRRLTIGLPTTANALQRSTDGQDFYLMQLSDGARVLDYATYFGTSADDHTDGGMLALRLPRMCSTRPCAPATRTAARAFPIPPGAYTYAAHQRRGPAATTRPSNLPFRTALSPAGPIPFRCAPGRRR